MAMTTTTTTRSARVDRLALSDRLGLADRDRGFHGGAALSAGEGLLQALEGDDGGVEAAVDVGGELVEAVEERGEQRGDVELAEDADDVVADEEGLGEERL